MKYTLEEMQALIKAEQPKENMNIEELTLKQIREIQNIVGSNNTTPNSHPWQIGKHYVIRTVTMCNYGKLVAVHNQELLLEDAAWIADTGRFHDFLKDPSKCNEMEPFTNQVVIGRGSVIDAQEVNPMKVSQK